MPKKVHSKAQSRLLWAKANQGEISKKKVEEMHQGVKVNKLPEHKKKGKHMHKSMGSKPGNTEYLVERPSQSSTNSDPVKDTIEAFDKNFPSYESPKDYTPVPGTSNSQVQIVPITTGKGKVPEGF